MSLYRTAIRSAAVSVLLGTAGAHPTAAADRVYDSRTIPLGNDQAFPAIAVATEDEGIEVHDESPRRYLRTVTLVTSLVVERKPEAEESLLETEGILAAALDHLAYEVERALTGNEFLQGTLSKRLTLRRFESEFDSDGEKPRAGARISWDAAYLEELPDTSEKPLVPFLHANVQMEAKVGDTAAESEDDIHLDQ